MGKFFLDINLISHDCDWDHVVIMYDDVYMDDIHYDKYKRMSQEEFLEYAIQNFFDLYCHNTNLYINYFGGKIKW